MLLSFSVFAYADWWDATKYMVRSIFDGSWFMDWSGTAKNYWDLRKNGDEPVHDAESYNTYITNNYDVTLYSSSGDYTFCPVPASIYLEYGSYGTSFDIPDDIGEVGGWLHYVRFKYISSNSSGILLYVEVSDGFDSNGPCDIKATLWYYFVFPYDGVYHVLNYDPFLGSSNSGCTKGIRVDFTVTGPGYITIPYPIFTCDTPDFTYNNYYEPFSRVGSITYNIVDSHMQNYYPNVQLFNEETNVYTDPSTGQQQNVQSWTYDYSTRTYHLTLDDGSLLDIEFGDGSIKVTLNGELTQEYYYTVEKEEEPGPTPTPEHGGPTPTPDPGTTPTPEPGPEPEDPDGFFAWLKQWLIDFKEWLGDWLDKLFNKEPGDITIDDSDNSVHINDQDDLDYDIYYTDDTGEQRKTSIRDLLHKFDFLRDIYDIGRDLFSIVGADAAMAHAYNSSGSVDITPYLGDLRTVAAADVMPIAGGAGAPSLKMNLGAAQSHYGFTYGGEIEILDLSWYTPYKATVDNLLSGFLWLFFVWRLFKHAPGIVSGAGMVTDKAEDIHDGKRH